MPKRQSTKSSSPKKQNAPKNEKQTNTTGQAEQGRAMTTRDEPFRNLINQVDHEVREMERRLNSLFSDTAIDWRGRMPLIHGWNIIPDRSGLPQFERFGNIVQSVENMLEGWRRPHLTHMVDEKKGHVNIEAEIPGVQKDDIEVRVQGETVDISAETENRKYHGRLTLGVPLDQDSVDANYRDGILHITAKLVKPLDKKGRKIQVS